MESKLTAPVAIIIAGVIIAGAVLYSGQNNPPQDAGQPAAPKYALDKVAPVSNQDHVRGASNAEITIVEYSDLECPFCKDFHKTMQQAMTDYSGRIAWVYRHFPLDIHPQAQKEAEATECVAELGGAEKYWQYVDKIFSVTPSNNRLDLTLLPQMAVELGIDQTEFETCLSSGRHASKIKAQTDNALEIGARGTPFSIVIFKNGKKAMIPGALPIEDLKVILEQK